MATTYGVSYSCSGGLGPLSNSSVRALGDGMNFIQREPITTTLTQKYSACLCGTLWLSGCLPVTHPEGGGEVRLPQEPPHLRHKVASTAFCARGCRTDPCSLYRQGRLSRRYTACSVAALGIGRAGRHASGGMTGQKSRRARRHSMGHSTQRPK